MDNVWTNRNPDIVQFLVHPLVAYSLSVNDSILGFGQILDKSWTLSKNVLILSYLISSPLPIAQVGREWAMSGLRAGDGQWATYKIGQN